MIDLFAGCGGFSVGFRSFRPDGARISPFRSIAAVEFDPAAAGTYALNFGSSHVHAGDIANFEPAPFAGEADVIMGGPPCQGFSGLGKERPDDPRNQLWREYMRVVTVVRPKIFVLENVDRFLRSAEFADLEAATEKPEGKLRDYKLTTKILNAADYGVPQARRRVIVIATHRDLPALKHPAPTHSKYVAEPSPAPSLFGEDDPAPLLPWATVAGVFGRTARRRITSTVLPEGRVCNPLGTLLPGHYETTELHIGRTPTALSLARYEAILPGGNRNHLTGRTALIDGEEVDLSTPSWDAHTKGSGDVMGRLHLTKPSVTIRTEFYKPEKGRYLHPTLPRPITHLEAALIQGFPDNYRWSGSKIQIARQIGNAVPVGLGEALAGAIHKHLRT
ncbi:DNA cytosine methyltransferase [Kitasatospora sp. NPDC057223]|uniref:DNA cytosine methyltransferase n=1 Tax=Kitasatospora sp. NPDC057223 TaxID=3346055 RepID=UPI00363A0B9D